MKKLLIIGAGGNIGRHLMRYFGKHAIGCYRTETRCGIQLDIQKNRIFEPLSNPKIVSHAIILAGIVDPSVIVSNPTKAKEINVDATWQLIKDLIELEITPIFTSSDALFGPNPGPHSEEDPVDPGVLYGKLKLEIEHRLSKLSDRWLILRIPRIYGLNRGDGTLITNLYEKILAGGKIPVASDQRFSPLYVYDLAQTIEKAIKSNLTGLFHLGGDQNVTHIDIANTIVKTLSKYQPINVKLIHKSINYFVKYEIRPLDITMNSEKIKKALDLTFLNITDAVQKIVLNKNNSINRNL
jgi:dTDP-4-dehydrorhamnose reductase